MLFSQITPKHDPSGFAAELMLEKDYYRASEELIPLILSNPYRNPEFSMLLEAAYHLNDLNSLNLIVTKHSQLKKPFQEKLYQTMTLIALRNNRPAEAQLYYRTGGDETLPFPIVNQSEFKEVEKAKRLSAFLPGAGLFYTGEYGKAAGTFVLNLLFVYLTVNAYENKNYGGALLFLFFEYQFYTGNIRASAESAEKYNRRLSQTKYTDFSAKLEFTLFSY